LRIGLWTYRGFYLGRRFTQALGLSREAKGRKFGFHQVRRRRATKGTWVTWGGKCRKNWYPSMEFVWWIRSGPNHWRDETFKPVKLPYLVIRLGRRSNIAWKVFPIVIQYRIWFWFWCSSFYYYRILVMILHAKHYPINLTSEIPNIIRQTSDPKVLGRKGEAAIVMIESIC
jgi:hypothetical protein